MTVLFCYGGVHAQVYQCMQPDGRLSYQQAPCAPGVKTRIVDTRPNTVSNAEERALFYRDRERVIGAQDYEAPAAQAPRTQARRGSNCPSEQVIKGWETSASSFTSKEASMYAKMARDARLCQMGMQAPQAARAPAYVEAPQMAPSPPPPTSIVSCSADGVYCYDNQGGSILMPSRRR